MSSLTHETGSRTGYRLRVYTAAGRRSIWLGPIPEKDAVAVQRHVDEIITAQTSDWPIPRQTQQWLDRLPFALRSKLSCITGASRTVSTAVDAYLHARRDVWALSTADSAARSLGTLSDALGSTRIEAVTADAVDAAHAAITSAPSTRGKIAKDWRAFFGFCVDSKWIHENPARHLSTAIGVRDKQFIPAEMVQRIIAAIDDPALAVVVAMSRWGGVRVSSEIRSLDWSRIDRTAGRIRIDDVKRGCEREIPLFPELASVLDRHPGDVPLCGDLIGMSHAGITARLHGVLDSLGIPRWAAPWHSMRATRETELIERFGVATASKWIGNSEAVAMRSYALVTDDAWTAAISPTV
jgi:integrase